MKNYIKPLITVITVVYNGEACLEKTILNVINQTYESVEYIIIDVEDLQMVLSILSKNTSLKINYWISKAYRWYL